MFRSLNAAAPAAPAATPEDATKQALLSVVQVWLDRLQAMAVITAFFVSIDSMVYSFPSRPPDFNAWSSIDLLVSASLGGAIILHVCASILAYIASFVLIRYRLSDAEKQEQSTERPCTASDGQQKTHQMHAQSLSTAPTLAPLPATEWNAYIDLRSLVSVHKVPFRQYLLCGMVPRKKRVKNEMEALATPDDPVVRLRSMVTVLIRCHTAIAVMTQLGFMLALLGILAYFWTGLPRMLGIWATVLLGGCLFGMGAVIV
ncbi:hypothetical protein BD309DRAFT_960824 [Dichomitus squalens]|uniref:Uncharacterized protein n=1 Tax=Dichomitus squalens TaxID=114155 RepID=A0A4Q9NPE5_9APHY|nr:hypothetical protein BD309DRAFT_960824 [Dichomitus squalens]TBU58224.1 hypothetical protein BD310DRAFT_879401 [Dichomitus squalens]